VSYPGTVSVTTPPAAEPLELAEVKAHLRVEHDAEDDLILRLLRMARQRAETDNDLALITQELEYRLDDWPSSSMIRLPRGPIQSVDEIAYVDQAGNPQVIDPANYEVDLYLRPARLRPAPEYTWPTVKDQLNAITITYTAGWGDNGEDVPEEIRQALLLIVGDFFENRESVIIGTISSQIQSVAAENLLEPFRTGRSF